MYTDSPQDILSRIKRMEEEIRDLRSKVSLSSATIRKGGIRLTEDSRIDAIDIEGDLVFRLGRLGFVYDDGRGQQGAEFRYENGDPALTIWAPSAHTVADRQYTAVWNGGTIVMSTDASSGFGLGRPWLPIAFSPGATTRWMSTTSAGYDNLLEANTHQQHPWIEARLVVSGTPGTTGDIRLTANGTQLGDVLTFDGVSAQTAIRSGRIVAGFGNQTQVILEGRRTAGAGTVIGRVDAWWRQT